MQFLNRQNPLEQHIVQVSDKYCLRFYVTDSTKTSCEKPLSGSGKSLNSAEKDFDPDMNLRDSTNQPVCFMKTILFVF